MAVPPGCSQLGYVELDDPRAPDRSQPTMTNCCGRGVIGGAGACAESSDRQWAEYLVEEEERLEVAATRKCTGRSRSFLHCLELAAPHLAAPGDSTKSPGTSCPPKYTATALT